MFILKKGLIKNILIAMPSAEPIPVVSSLIGREYSEETMNGVIAALKSASTENVKLAMNSSL